MIATRYCRPTHHDRSQIVSLRCPLGELQYFSVETLDQFFGRDLPVAANAILQAIRSSQYVLWIHPFENPSVNRITVLPSVKLMGWAEG